MRQHQFAGAQSGASAPTSAESERSCSSRGTRSRTAASAPSSAGVDRSGRWNSMPWHAHTSSIATTCAAQSTIWRALSAAHAPIELKSSMPAEVGTEPAPAGCASTWHSLTSAACVYCAIIRPEESPGCGVRKRGSPA